jgi:hypothetical protein
VKENENIHAVYYALIVGLPESECPGTVSKLFSIDNSPATSISLDARQRLIVVTEKGKRLILM